MEIVEKHQLLLRFEEEEGVLKREMNSLIDFEEKRIEDMSNSLSGILKA